MTKQASCPICGSDQLQPFLFRGRVPVHQNLVLADRATAVGVNRGDLDLVWCSGCDFIFNKAFDAAALEYGQAYDNTQACSAYFNDYLDDLVAHLVGDRAVRDSFIVEVGCGKGLFLRKLVEFPDSGNEGRGFDSSYEGPTENLDGRLRFEKRYLNGDEVSADILISRHVIEHVPDPVRFLRTLQAAAAPGARLFLETPSTEWILEQGAFWDFFYEHCCYFTERSLGRALAAAEFTVCATTRIFNDQYMWVEAAAGGDRAPAVIKEKVSDPIQRFAEYEASLQIKLCRQLAHLAGKGRVALWGAGAKGVTFANLVDPDGCLIDCVVDLNPRKQGAFVPGTGHPIVGFEQLSTRGVATALLMNPNYFAENAALLAKAHSQVELVDLTEQMPYEIKD